VQEFNKGVYDYIIATDESEAGQEHDSEEEPEEEEAGEEEEKGDECNLIAKF
jgi:ATP-dependent RNA helicase DDX56/DBP9